MSKKEKDKCKKGTRKNKKGVCTGIFELEITDFIEQVEMVTKELESVGKSQQYHFEKYRNKKTKKHVEQVLNRISKLTERYEKRSNTFFKKHKEKEARSIETISGTYAEQILWNLTKYKETENGGYLKKGKEEIEAHIRELKLYVSERKDNSKEMRKIIWDWEEIGMLRRI